MISGGWRQLFLPEKDPLANTSGSMFESDNNHVVKGQNVKRLAQVAGYKMLPNFWALFTQGRFAIKK